MRHGETTLSVQVVINNVRFKLGELSPMLKVKHSATNIEKVALEILELDVIPQIVRHGVWVKWEPPPLGKIKLSVDGAYKNGIMGCGGLVRNNKGEVLLHYSYQVRGGNAATAEWSALHKGLQLAKQYGIAIRTLKQTTIAWFVLFVLVM